MNSTDTTRTHVARHPARRAATWLAVAFLATVMPAPAWAQFVDAEPATSGPRLGDARPLRFRVGMIVAATGGSLRDIYATMPVPG